MYAGLLHPQALEIRCAWKVMDVDQVLRRQIVFSGGRGIIAFLHLGKQILCKSFILNTEQIGMNIAG